MSHCVLPSSIDFCYIVGKNVFEYLDFVFFNSIIAALVKGNKYLKKSFIVPKLSKAISELSLWVWVCKWVGLISINIYFEVEIQVFYCLDILYIMI